MSFSFTSNILQALNTIANMQTAGQTKNVAGKGDIESVKNQVEQTGAKTTNDVIVGNMNYDAFKSPTLSPATAIKSTLTPAAKSTTELINQLNSKLNQNVASKTYMDNIKTKTFDIPGVPFSLDNDYLKNKGGKK